MDFLVQNGIHWIVAIQSWGEWLTAPMMFFTSLGYENFYLLLLPLLYWSIDSRLGLRVGLILITSTGVNEIFKLAFAGPRPYWVSDLVKPLSSETSFGIPSGHAQNAVAVWGIVAGYFRKPWAWIAAIALMFLIGFSRLYLGVHFLQDALVGWLIGAVILALFLRLWDSTAARVQKLTLFRQILLAFVVSMLFVIIGALLVYLQRGYQLPGEWLTNAQRAGNPAPDPISLDGFLTAAGTLFGLLAGAAWILQRGGFSAEGPFSKRALRYVLGVIGVAILWMGLGQIFPRDADLISYTLRYIRYTLVGFWVTGGAPWLFFRFKL